MMMMMMMMILSNPVIKQTNNKLTNADENVTSLAVKKCPAAGQMDRCTDKRMRRCISIFKIFYIPTGGSNRV